MTITSLSLPVDIPWKRIAFSQDMMDQFACDRSLPLRWRSSVAVFEYEPPEDQQEMDGFLISYLKVSCSITGYQPNGPEIQIRQRIARSGWTHLDNVDTLGLKNKLGQLVNHYYPCFGAMLEVVVAPPETTKGMFFSQYPHFVDFDPKKREMYEQVTETGESMSRSLDDVNVRKGQTTLQSHEVKDKVSISGTAGVSAGGLGASATAGYENTTTDLSQKTTENLRTTDAARENRETFSHTTQMSHLYQLLNSYHIGTNRAAFFVLSRPHTNQVPSTFVNGPREIEGIQDFMLVVARPADQKRYCVEAYLETAHLIRTPIPGPGDTKTGELHLGPDNFGAGQWSADGLLLTKEASVPFPVPAGFEIDVGRDGSDGPHGGGPGYKIDTQIQMGSADLSWDVAPDHLNLIARTVEEYVRVTHSGVPIGGIVGPKVGGYTEKIKVGEARVELTATIFLKKIGAFSGGFSDQLLLTARSVCSCTRDSVDASGHHYDIVFEERMLTKQMVGRGPGEEMDIRDANQFSAEIRQEMMQSITSADRYPRNTVSLLDTQLVADTMSAALPPRDRTANPRLSGWVGDGQDIARRVSQYAPMMTRSELLRVPLPEQVERFGLTFEEATTLRRALVDLPAPDGPPPVPDYRPVSVPRLVGRTLQDAREIVADLELDLVDVTQVDNPLAAGIVVEQSPEPDVTVPPATEVSLAFSSGLSVVMPDLIGLSLAEGMCALLDAGLQSDPTVEGPTGPDTRVADVEPPPGTLITPHAAVTIRLRTMREQRPELE
ncbi:PASTA domain-containing protein [Nocardia vinacea]|uniref:PASTA domain-containing protein n=1 Tax=Nocardia vinacea TaxID=96468 RepID=UPI002E15B8ED|nr:PASTA domain-containing protein [Nocardia vinacea]